MTRLLIIYGLEASGKLTIAKEVAALTVLKLFHNHISIEVGRVLFEYGDQEYNDLIWKVRLAVFEAAGKNQLPGVVFTWAYCHPDFRPQLDLILEKIKPYWLEVSFVYVKCSQAELERRVIQPDPKEAGKAHTIDTLHRQQRAKNHVEIPDSNSYVIDSTTLQVQDSAKIIVDRFCLNLK